MSRKLIFYGYSETSAPNIVTDDLILYLDAGQPSSYGGSGVNWLDLSGEGNDATLINGVPYNSAEGGYLEFDGVSDYAECLSWATTLSSPITFSIWINVASGSASLPFCYGFGSGYNLSYFFTRFGVIYFYMNNHSWSEVSRSITIGNWVNATVTYDKTLTSNNIKLYVNGLEVDTANYTIDINSGITPQVRVGRRVDGGSPTNFEGGASQTLIYTKALSAAEVLQNFNAIKDRYGL
jgi:hypothetical protein